MKFVKFFLLATLFAYLAGCATMGTSETSGKEGDRQDVLYTCNCGPQCDCNTVSTTAGKCACGVPLKWGHVLKIEGDEAILCQCNEGCKCAGLDAKDPTKCACGAPVKRVSLKGTGIHFCNCGGSCYCNTVSSAPGKCKCGMDLKVVN